MLNHQKKLILYLYFTLRSKDQMDKRTLMATTGRLRNIEIIFERPLVKKTWPIRKLDHAFESNAIKLYFDIHLTKVTESYTELAANKWSKANSIHVALVFLDSWYPNITVNVLISSQKCTIYLRPFDAYVLRYSLWCFSCQRYTKIYNIILPLLFFRQL